MVCILVSLIFDTILPTLVHIINLSLETGIEPDELKIGKVLPFFKSNNSHIFNMYRPISILPILSKVFEKIKAPSKYTQCAVTRHNRSFSLFGDRRNFKGLGNIHVPDTKTQYIFISQFKFFMGND